MATPPRARPSLLEALCQDDPDCRVDSVEPLALPADSGRPHLVRTWFGDATAASAPWEAKYPVYWIVVLDGAGRVLRFQQLIRGFERGKEPDSDDLWSTFTLVVDPVAPGPVHATLRVREPSPSGTAWGLRGFVRFTWPDFKPIAWEYDAFHAINDSLSSAERWSWEARAGGSSYSGLWFGYALPQVAMDETFTAGAWTGANMEACSSRLQAKDAEHLPGDHLSPHALTAALSSRAELFVELTVAEKKPLSERATIEVCYAGEVLRSEREFPGMPPPDCVRWGLDGSTNSPSARIEKAPDRLRYKLTLPAAELVELPGVTLVLRDPQNRQSLLSSAFDFKSHRRLGQVIEFSPEQVTCVLRQDALVPHFGPRDARAPLMDQLR